MAKGWSFGALVKALKGAAFLDIGTVANSVAAGNDSRIVGAAQKGNNLADLTDYAKARNQLSAAYIHGDTSVKFWALDSPGDSNSVVTIGRLNTVANTKANWQGDSDVDFFCRNNGYPTGAVNNQRLDYRLQSKADTNGNQYTQFNVGGATGGTHAVRLDQFQSGSNGNGAWTKLPGGGQWCRTNITIPAKGGITWNFPIGFVSAPAVFITNINGNQSIWPTGVGPNNASFYNDNPTPSNVNLLAIW